jgi:hypothetical protein
MSTRRILALCLAVALCAAGGTLLAQDDLDDGSELKRLYPRYANPDGTLNCAPKCGLLGPCC